MADTKFLCFDTETTHNDKERCGLLTLSGAVIVNNIVLEYFDFRCRPQEGVTIGTEAFGITGIDIKEIWDWPSPVDMMNEFDAMMGQYKEKFNKNDKFFPLAYNGSFDLEVMSQFYKRNGDKYGFGKWQNWTLIDPLASVNGMVAMGTLVIPDRKLGTVCGHYGIELQAHNSLSDIKATIELAKITTRVGKDFNTECTKPVRRNYD